MKNEYIIIKGARVHNLKDIDVKIPKNKLVVVTGLSGSGKSSLAFDTIFAEGQRRYIESLSNYAKQFLGTIPKPELDHIEGLSPAISIDQKSTIRSPRSTVATMSDTYDYIRLLFAKAGEVYCHKCSVKMTKKDIKNKNSKKTIVYTCPKCNSKINNLTISSFSFNSPEGACPDCRGLGKKTVIDSKQVMPNPRLTLAEGAIRPLSRSATQLKNHLVKLTAIGKKIGFDINTPVGKLSKQAVEAILYGTDGYEGVLKELQTKFENTDSVYIKNEIKKYMVEQVCPTCHGLRLKQESLAVKVNGLNISEFCDLTVDDLKTDLIKFKETTEEFSKSIVSEIITRLNFLEEVGLHYLTLSRNSVTLSGGEAQRIRLSTQLGASLSGIIYILDEPSIGLHPVDQSKLIDVLKKLRDLGNTVIVVEHDKETIQAADYVIDLGPGAGEFGGKIIASGKYEDIILSKKSLTARYLRGERVIEKPKNRRSSEKYLEIIGAQAHNLKNIDVKLPLNVFTCITGVSGSGKSSLVLDILAKKLKKHFYNAKSVPGNHKEVTGLDQIDKVIVVDQSPIGKTPRSNPVTYTGIFSLIREVYADLEESKKRRFNSGHFSFNVIGGRCETCKGDGVLKFEMYFLPDTYVTCPECGGKRYNKDVLDIKYKPTGFPDGKNIADVLDMTVTEALKFFKGHQLIHHKLQVLDSVGLGYIRLGQSATTLSGGEAQRIKLATELARKDTNKTFYILDEPTTGLHFEDINKLLKVLQALVDKGNTVVVIEHNLDVIKSADHIIDMGPEGGVNGGKVVAEGTPENISASNTITGQFLKKAV